MEVSMEVRVVGEGVIFGVNWGRDLNSAGVVMLLRYRG
jgi:hypothetical protein